jgi:hypothetical protein
MWQNFNTKRGTQQKKNGRYGNPQHTFFTNGIYFVQYNTIQYNTIFFIPIKVPQGAITNIHS